MAQAPSDDEALFAPQLMARVRQIQIRTHRLVNDALAGAYRSTFRGSGIEFEEVRPYQPGDEVRSIDWNRTARSGEPFVKTYVEERELTLQFLVDTSPSMDFGSRELTKRETAASFCALLSYVALRQQDQVGLTLFGERPGLHLPPAKGAGAVARVVREVIAARSPSPGSDFRGVLEQAQRTLRRRALVFLVSDFDAPGDAWADDLAALGRRHDVVCARVVDPFEEELPRAGRVLLRDPESGRELDVDTRSRAVRDAWAEAARERRAAFEELVRRARVERVELSTVGDVAEPAVAFFRRRRRRRAAGAAVRGGRA